MGSSVLTQYARISTCKAPRMDAFRKFESNENCNQKVALVIDLLYGPIVFCIKLSLFLLYHRLFAVHQWMRYLVYLGIGSMGVVYLVCMILFGYLCIPRPGETWIEAALSSRYHTQFDLISYVLGPFNLLSDLFLLLLPLPPIYQLHMPLRKRIAIAGIFLTGSL